MISRANLAEFPQFLRFHNVFVRHNGSQTISQKCQLFDGCLKSISAALRNSNEIQFVCFVNEKDPTQFKDHVSLVNYLQNTFLTICNSSNRYVFDCYSRSDKDEDVTINAIASILRMPQIVRCLDVSIKIRYLFDYRRTQLPFEAINQWINQKSEDSIDAIAQHRQEKFLRITANGISNVAEMWDNLTEVLLI